jgi:hypothetical protein
MSQTPNSASTVVGIAKARHRKLSAIGALRHALSPTFPAGAMVFFIPSRGGAEDVAEGSGAAHLDRRGPPGWCSGC